MNADELNVACARAMGWNVYPPGPIFYFAPPPAGSPMSTGPMQDRGDGCNHEVDTLRAYSTDPKYQDEMIAWLQGHGATVYIEWRCDGEREVIATLAKGVGHHARARTASEALARLVVYVAKVKAEGRL